MKGGKDMKLKTSQKQMSESLWTIAFLTLSGGLQDSYSYFVRGKVFANAQTGNLVFLASSLFEGDWMKFIHYLIPVLFFACGVYAAARARTFLSRFRKIHWRQWILFAEILLLCLVPFIEDNVIANSVISFCCAMQVQSFRKFRGQAFNSTMCVANTRGAMESLAHFRESRDPRKKEKLINYLLVLFFFCLGAGVGSWLATKLGLATIWISSLFLTVSLLMMFIEIDVEEESNPFAE